jgi:nucleotide-binding universal stress UspA family protein
MILLKARCDVAIVRLGKNMDLNIKKILLPTAGGPHSTLAAELAHDIAEQEGSEITMLHVGSTPDIKEDAQTHFEDIEETFEGTRITQKFLVSSNITRTIALEAGKNDAVFIGATNRPFLKNFLLGVFPEKIVKQTDTTVIMTRKWVKIVDALKR